MLSALINEGTLTFEVRYRLYILIIITQCCTIYFNESDLTQSHWYRFQEESKWVYQLLFNLSDGEYSFKHGEYLIWF